METLEIVRRQWTLTDVELLRVALQYYAEHTRQALRLECVAVSPKTREALGRVSQRADALAEELRLK